MFRAERFAGLCDSEHLRVCRRVLQELHLIMGPSDDLILADQDRAHGNLVFLRSFFGLTDSLAHVMKIELFSRGKHDANLS